MMLRNWLAGAFLALASFTAAPVFADQGSLCLPTTGTVSGLTVVQDVNAGLQALVTSNSGTSPPGNPCSGAPVTGQMWLDGSATPAVLRVYDGANWLGIGAVDAVSHLWTPPVGGGASSIASAGTTNLGSLPQAYLSITGSTTITGLGTSATLGTIKVLRFAGALTLTHNATSLILPTAANIVTAANDRAIAVSLGGVNWIVVSYERADGTPLALGTGQVATANIAAAAVTTAKIANNAVTNALAAQMPAATLKGNAGTATANAGDLSTAQVRVLPGLALRGQLFGLTLSNDASTPASVIDTAVGEAADDSATPTLMSLGSAFTKSIASSWAVGSGNGCLDTGSVADGTYHIFLIERLDTSVVDELCSTSVASPAMPSGYTVKRRIGSIIRASGAVLAFVQDGKSFSWKTATPPKDYTGSTRSKAALALTVPTGIRVSAVINLNIYAPGSTTQVVTLYDGANPTTPNLFQIDNPGSGNNRYATMVNCFTDSSAQIQISASRSGSGSGTADVNTMGWIDTSL